MALGIAVLEAITGKRLREENRGIPLGWAKAHREKL
jgi:hypothetical protein|tara:strand:- start:100 stop:207 length:108 start_codon:yes stop_codon:yes gene_type:complete